MRVAAVFFWIISIGLISTAWPIGLFSVLMGVFCWWYPGWQAKKRERAERISDLVEIGYKVQTVLGKMKTLKTPSAQVNKCGEAIALLNAAATIPEHLEVIQNLNVLRAQLRAMEKVIPVIGHVEKSYKHKFKGNEKSELNALKDAMFEVKTKGVTEQDLNLAEIYPETTGEVVTIAGIEGRCRALGWNGV